MCAKRKQQILATVTCFLLVVAVVLGVVINAVEKRFIFIGDNETPLAGGPQLVEQTSDDTYVIPDKYNTGCKGELTKISGETTVNGIKFKVSSGKLILDFAYSNTNAEGTILLENLDFSGQSFAVNNEGKVSGRKIDVVFNNCKFATVKNAYPKSEVFSYTFNNCSIVHFSGSNATFNNCQFGHTYNDGMNPFANVHVYDSYFLDLASSNTNGAGKHSDGVQVFANKDVPAEDIVFERCRFEIPYIKQSGNTAYVNSCIAVALEYNYGDNIYIKNCITNGGGYTFYAHSKASDKSLTNTSFENVRVGGAAWYGDFYPTIGPAVAINEVNSTQSLYVSSVWKDIQGTHIIVTNDTNIERTLKVVTNSKEYTYPIKACLGGNNLRYDNVGIPFSDFPFDIDIVIPEDAEYVICYDSTNNQETQIRFVNWKGEPVYIGGVIEEEPKAEKKNNKNKKKISKFDAEKPVIVEVPVEEKVEESPAEDDIEPLSGVCGSGLVFTLSSDGILTISGEGGMSNYNSGKPTPWNERMSEIKKVIIGDGVTSIGSQAFHDAVNLSEIQLSSSVNKINSNSFMGCKNLKYIELGTSIVSIGQYAFSSSGLESVLFHGTEEEWNQIEIGDHNSSLINNVVFEKVSEVSLENENTAQLIEGTCGAGLTFSLGSDGMLCVSGEGNMSDFSSGKPAPWNEYLESIVQVVIEEGVTSVGNQAFRNATNLQTVSLPQSVTELGNNSFMGCTGLKDVFIPRNVEYIGEYAFSGTGLSYARYEGTAEEFALVSVGEHNSKLLNSVTYSE